MHLPEPTLFYIGLFLFIAALIGGGLEFAGVKIPVLTTTLRKLLLGTCGAVLMFIGRGPKDPCKSTDGLGRCTSIELPVNLTGMAATKTQAAARQILTSPKMAPGKKQASFSGTVDIDNPGNATSGIIQIGLADVRVQESRRSLIKDGAPPTFLMQPLVAEGDGPDWEIILLRCSVTPNQEKACSTKSDAKLVIKMAQ